MKKESTRVFELSDRFPYCISALPGDISYLIVSSVRLSMDLIRVWHSAVTPAQTISCPGGACLAWPDTRIRFFLTLTSINAHPSLEMSTKIPLTPKNGWHYILTLQYQEHLKALPQRLLLQNLLLSACRCFLLKTLFPHKLSLLEKLFVYIRRL